MWRIIELLNIQSVVDKFYDCAFIIVHITIVWRAENSDHNWKFLRPIPAVHLVTVQLRFMRSDH